MRKKILFVFFSSFLIQLLNVIDCEQRMIPQLLVISFDGFRWDYINRYHTPTFDFIAKTGVRAPFGLRTSFVSKTFPAHWTIATGLYPESHGIIDNKFYDPLFNETFTVRNKDAKWWNGQPIWVTAKRQAKRVGIYFWPGSDINGGGVSADFWYPYTPSVSFEEQTDTVVKWLKDDDLDMAMVYFNQPDKAGHDYGTNSIEVKNAVESADKLIDSIIKRLNSELFNNINVIILSDHGMANLTSHKDNQIVLSNYIDTKNDVISIPQMGSLSGIIPYHDKVKSVYNKLKNAHPNMTVYLKEEIPKRYHYQNNRRITPIIAIADEGFIIVESRWNYTNVGYHGYDNELASMNPIFYAHGPDFRQNTTIGIFETVNIYPLMCHVLRIEPSSNNGSMDQVMDILTDESRERIQLKKSLANSDNQLSRILIMTTVILLCFYETYL